MSMSAASTSPFFVNVQIKPGTKVQAAQRYAGVSLTLSAAKSLRLAVRNPLAGGFIATNVTQADFGKLTLADSTSMGSDINQMQRNILETAGLSGVPHTLALPLAKLVANDEHMFLFDKARNHFLGSEIAEANQLLQALGINAEPLNITQKLQLLRAVIGGDISTATARNLSETPGQIADFFSLQEGSDSDLQWLAHEAFNVSSARQALFDIYAKKPRLAMGFAELAELGPPGISGQTLRDMVALTVSGQTGQLTPFPLAIPLLLQARLVATGRESPQALNTLIGYLQGQPHSANGLASVAEADLTLALALGRLNQQAPQQVDQILRVWHESNHWYAEHHDAIGYELRGVACRMTSLLEAGLTEDQQVLLERISDQVTELRTKGFNPKTENLQFSELGFSMDELNDAIQTEIKNRLGVANELGTQQIRLYGSIGPQNIRDYLAKELVPLLLNDDGRLDTIICEQVIELFGKSKRQEARDLARVIEQFLKDPQLRQTLEGIQLGVENQPAQLLLRSQFGLAPDAPLTNTHARRAALAAMLSGLRQRAMGSCFASAVALFIKESQPLQMLTDLSHLLASGTLPRTIAESGGMVQVPMMARVNNQDLQTTIRIDTNGRVTERREVGADQSEVLNQSLRLMDLRSIRHGFAAMGLGDRLEEVAQQVNLLAAENSIELSFEALFRQIGSRLLGMDADSQTMNERVAQAGLAFESVHENSLQKVWEFTLSSLAEVDQDSKLIRRLFKAIWDGAQKKLAGQNWE